MAIQASDIGDLITNTINELGRMKFTDISTDIQVHVALPKLLKKNRQMIDSGPIIQWNLMTGHNNSARGVGLGATDVVDIPDLMIQGQIPWRHVTANYAVEHHVVDMNRNPAKIVDIVNEQRFGCLISIAEYFEDRLWRAPPITDTVNFHGIPMYVVKNNSEGFNGLAASTYTLVGNINPTTNTRWRNYTAQYVAITKDDLLAKWWRASSYTDWLTAVEGMPTFNTGNDYGFYTNMAAMIAFKQAVEAQNENLGYDMDSMEGKVMFRRTPVTFVKKLDDDTTNPIYGINWGEFKMVVLQGWWMRETKIPVQPGQHTVTSNHVDCTCNLLTRNRRRHFVLATDTAMPA